MDRIYTPAIQVLLARDLLKRLRINVNHDRSTLDVLANRPETLIEYPLSLFHLCGVSGVGRIVGDPQFESALRHQGPKTSLVSDLGLVKPNSFQQLDEP